MEGLNSLSSTTKCKLAFLGYGNVGKTSIITKFVLGTINDYYEPTREMYPWFKTLYFDDRNVDLQIWDTSTRSRIFSSLIPSYIRYSSAVIIVIDVTDRQALSNADRWIKAVKTCRGTDAIIILVGNKAEKVKERRFTLEEAAARAKEWEVYYIEVSAKTGVNITSLFALVTWGSTARKNLKLQMD